MPLDPQIKAYLDDLASKNGPPVWDIPIAEIRENTRLESSTFGVPEAVARLEDRTVPGLNERGADAFEVPIRIYAPDLPGPLGAFVFYHGGGWITGDIPTHEGICCTLANQAGCVVISVDYRRAPEHKYPIAVNDAYAATVWVCENAASLGVDPARIAVGGDSSGGNLAAAVAQMLRDNGDFRPALQVLVYPVLDYRFDTPSYRENAAGYGLTRESMQWYWQCYLAKAEDGGEPYASPLRAESLAGLPPTLIQTAEYDPLRDEGETYACRLRGDGVAVQLTRYDGMIHGFFRRGAMFDRAHEAVREVAAALRKAFS